MKRAVASLIVALALPAAAQAQTIVDIAASNEEFSTLVGLVEAAGMVGALTAPGPFTLFAPTDAAFDALPDGLLAALEADPDTLAELLNHHLIPGQLLASDVSALGAQGAVTLQGEALPVRAAGADVAVGGARLTVPDIIASNGVVHGVDAVLIPASVSAALPPPDETGAPDTAYTSTALRAARFALEAVAGSGVSGSVLVTDYGPERTVIVVGLTGTPAPVAAELRAGDCGSGGGVVVPLTAVGSASGLGVTTTSTPYDAIAGGDLYLEIRRTTGADAAIACGEVGADAGRP